MKQFIFAFVFAMTILVSGAAQAGLEGSVQVVGQSDSRSTDIKINVALTGDYWYYVVYLCYGDTSWNKRNGGVLIDLVSDNPGECTVLSAAPSAPALATYSIPIPDVQALFGKSSQNYTVYLQANTRNRKGLSVMNLVASAKFIVEM